MAEYKRDDDIQYCLAEYYDEFARIPMDLLNMIDDLESIDIIRCSECKYYVYDYKGDWWSCSNRHGMGNSSFDDYCSHGERAEQKGESK